MRARKAHPNRGGSASRGKAREKIAPPEFFGKALRIIRAGRLSPVAWGTGIHISHIARSSPPGGTVNGLPAPSIRVGRSAALDRCRLAGGVCRSHRLE